MKSYDPAKIEGKWQREWQKKRIYKSDNPSNNLRAGKSKKKKYYVLDMFPYPSGEGLHVGHPKGYIATDIISRMKRMQGMNVLHPMGFDAFGLPAENYAIKTKTHPEVAVKKNVARYKKQLELLGFDYDWSREVNTTDPKFYKWTQWIFLKLLEKGLAYESNEPVNWCPVDQTVLANEDVEDGKCERCGAVVEKKPMRQWVLKITKYADRLLKDLDTLDWPENIKESQRNWIGRSEGAEIPFKISFDHGQKEGEIPVFTTRPDTLFGATFMVLSPEHAWVKLAIDENHLAVLDNRDEVVDYVRKAATKTEIERTDASKEKTGVELKGVKAINPATGEKLPLFVGDYVLADYGTGAVMGVPAHDERDFEFAKKYNLPIKHIVIPSLIDHKNPHVPGKEVVFRKGIMGIVYNPRTKKYLILKWKKQPWTTFIMGGIEEGEDPVGAAKREIAEETGYKYLKFKRILGSPTEVHFFAAHKDLNRIGHTTAVLFELESEVQDEISDEEAEMHDMVWISEEEVTPEKMTHIETDIILDRIKNGDKAYLGEGVLINSGKFNGLSNTEAIEKITKEFGKKIIKYKLRDWVFSRQRYWGEPIPVLHTENGEVVPLKEKDLPLKLPNVKSYKPTGTGESPLAHIKKWVEVKQKGKTLRRETNTMPQWAGSSWYYLRYMDPLNSKVLVDKKAEKYWNQVDYYVGGAEHATRHLIYARFWHKFLYDLGAVSTKEPFKKLQSVGLIMGTDGRKMSKRFGNVINPDDIVKKWGADSLRLYEMFMGPFTDSVAWNTDNMIGVRRFLEKVWKLSAKVSSKKGEKTDPKQESLIHKTIKKVSEDIVGMKFNTAISSMMILANELESASVEGHGVTRENFNIFLQLLAPFAPHIAEELWSHSAKASRDKRSIHLSAWPKFNPKKIKEDEVTIVVQVNGKVRASFKANLGISEEKAKEEAMSLPDIKKWIEGKEIKKVIFVPNKIINVVI